MGLGELQMFSWNYDDEPYILIRNGEDRIDLRPSNTLLYVFDDIHKDADHIFRIIGETEHNITGFRIWRSLVDKALGEDMFDKMCDELHEHGFDHADDTEPSEYDIKAWEDYTGLSYDCRPVIESIVQKAVDGLGSEIAYYLGE